MVVLDAWAVMALYEDRPCAPKVEAAIDADQAMISAINLGEVSYGLERLVGRRKALALVAEIRHRCRVDHPTAGMIVRAAAIKAHGRVSYADAFCVALAEQHHIPLWTGDPEILALAGPDLEVVDLR